MEWKGWNPSTDVGTLSAAWLSSSQFASAVLLHAMRPLFENSDQSIHAVVRQLVPTIYRSLNTSLLLGAGCRWNVFQFQWMIMVAQDAYEWKDGMLATLVRQFNISFGLNKPSFLPFCSPDCFKCMKLRCCSCFQNGKNRLVNQLCIFLRIALLQTKAVQYILGSII